jgi:transcriptional regulator with XRE-family HTH domain
MLWRMNVMVRPFGELLRDWRQRRRLSQLDLALEAEISQRHLSFMESGRAEPSRDMVLRLAEQLDMPLRERNVLLLAAGFAPFFRDRALTDPALAPARAAVERVLAAHEPYPALACDRHWTMLMANRALSPLLAGVDPALLAPPVNLVRVALSPAGMAPRIANLGEWHAELMHRLRRQVQLTGDPVLGALLEEAAGYPAPPPEAGFAANPVAVTLRLRTAAGELALLTTTTVFGNPTEIALAELAVEMFFPADEATAAAMRG